MALRQKSCTKELSNSLALLLRLGVPSSNVQSQFMEICARNLNEQIDTLSKLIECDKSSVRLLIIVLVHYLTSIVKLYILLQKSIYDILKSITLRFLD